MKLTTLPLALTCILLVSGCNNPESTSTAPDEPVDSAALEPQEPAPLPEKITLTDQRGRSLSVKILGRDQDEVSFLRLSDSRPFRWKIASLSTSDQALINALPITTLEQSPDDDAEKDRYVLSRTKDISRLEAEISELEKELKVVLANAPKGISPRAKGIETLIEKKHAETLTLQKEIETRRNR